MRKKILSGAFIKAYFYHFAAGIYIGYGKIAEPVVGVHPVTSTGATSAVALTSIRFACAAVAATHEFNLRIKT